MHVNYFFALIFNKKNKTKQRMETRMMNAINDVIEGYDGLYVYSKTLAQPSLVNRFLLFVPITVS